MKSLLVCTNHRHNPNQPSCGGRDGVALKRAIAELIQHEVINLAVQEIQCLGECESGPNVRLVPSGPLLRGVNKNDLSALIKAAKEFAKD